MVKYEDNSETLNPSCLDRPGTTKAQFPGFGGQAQEQTSRMDQLCKEQLLLMR